MSVPKTKKDPAEEQDPKQQPSADPTGDPPKEDPPVNSDGDGAAPAGDPPAADPSVDPADPEDPPAADPTDPKEPPAPEPAAEPTPDTEEVAALKLQLLESNSRIAAYKAGVKPDAVDDAVVLAMHAVKASGEEPSEEGITAALAAVLQRHPEWTAAAVPKAPEKAGAPPSQTEPVNEDEAYLKNKYANNPYYKQ